MQELFTLSYLHLPTMPGIVSVTEVTQLMITKEPISFLISETTPGGETKRTNIINRQT